MTSSTTTRSNRVALYRRRFTGRDYLGSTLRGLVGVDTSGLERRQQQLLVEQRLFRRRFVEWWRGGDGC